MAELTCGIWRQMCLRRNIVCVMALLGFLNVFSLRSSLSVSIITMTEKYTTTAENGDVEYEQAFDWNSEDKEIVLSSFFYGYLFTQILGGWLSSKIGGARLYGVGVVVTAVVHLVIPVAAYHGIGYIVVIRSIEGIFEGVTYPCIYEIWSKWAPAEERTRLVTLSLSGGLLGTVISFPACGFLAQRFGWESCFYVTGGVAIMWWITWFIFIKDDPQEDPWISDSELKYIKESQLSGKRKLISHPWKSFFTSMPVLATCCAHFAENWGLFTMLTQLPIFMNDVFQFDVESAGLLSAIPYLAEAIVMSVGGIVADKVRRGSKLTTTQVRKLFSCSATSFQMIFILCAAFVTSIQATLTFITLTIAVGGLAWSGFGASYLDMAPQHAGVLMGISQTFGAIPGVISPILTGYVVRNRTKVEWRIVFLVIGLIYFLTTIFYATFASANKQTWAVIPDTDENESSNKVKTDEKFGGKSEIDIKKY